MATNKQQLAQLLTDFAAGTVLGQESGIYKAIVAGKMPDVEVTALTRPTSAGAFRQPTINYLNHCYRSLILKNDPYVVEKFEAMTKLLHHSEICLLNIICQLVTSIQKSVCREGLDPSSYANYMGSLEHQVTILCIYQRLLLVEQILTHNCSGKPISEYNPEEPMFS
jgi:hypothetical protein